MSCRLAEFSFSPRGKSGWELPTVQFGSVLTLITGPNGAGKTPIAKGLAFALGHPIELPPDIRTNCRSVTLALVDHEGRTQVERAIEQRFAASTIEPTGTKRDFTNEAEFAAWMIQRLGIPERQFAGIGNAVVPPYMGVLLPLFWIDQDLGWRNLYSPLHTSNFVKDQGEEVVRWLLGVPAKHRAVDKSAFAKAKAAHESINELIQIKRNTLAALRRSTAAGTTPGSREDAAARRETLLAELRTHTSVLDVFAQSNTALDERLSAALTQRDSAKFALDAATRRLATLHRIGQEVRAEVSILETNEVAADAFRTLCGNEACQFFRRPEESYGRKLLYLKDQLKDFGSSSASLESEIQRLRNDLEEQEGRAARARDEKQNGIASTRAGQIVPVIDAITKELSEVNLRLEQFDRLEKERKQLEALIAREQKASASVNELRPTGGRRTDQGRLTEARATLGACFEEWLKTLRTQNVDVQVSFDEDFRLRLGTERFSESSSYSGSTRTRIVLAFHAAMIEASLKIGGSHPGFLILDAPKQHELHAQDLGAFVSRFREVSLALKEPVQLVIAATEQDFVADDLADSIARPQFGTKERPRFFGSAAPLRDS
jgi:AAA domain